MSDKRSIPAMSVDTRVLMERLIKSDPGETISYEELNELIGRDVQSEAQPSLYSARRAALNEQVAFETIRNLGIRRCDDVAIVKQMEHGIHRIHRSARRTAKVAQCVDDVSKLDKSDRDKFNMRLSIISVMSHATSTKVSKRLEQKVSDLGTSLPVAKMLEALK